MKKPLIYLLLLTVPLFGFWIIPQKERVKNLQANVAQLEEETAEHQDQIKKLKNLDTILSDEKYEGVLERIPSTLEQETLILILQKIAQSTGYVFEGITFNRGQNATLETSTLKASFSVRGREDKFIQFLQAIEKSPRFIGLESFTYNVSQVNGIDIVNLSVPLYAFAQSSEN